MFIDIIYNNIAKTFNTFAILFFKEDFI